MENIIKFLILGVFIFLVQITKAQEVEFGVLAGSSVVDIEIDKPLRAGNSASPFNIGAYVDLPFSERFGVKSHLLYHLRSEQDFSVRNSNDFQVGNFRLETTSIDVQPLLKYDVSNTYNKGFYLLAGPRLSFVISTAFNEGDAPDDVDGFYKNTNFGANLGFGFTFLDHFGLELLFDYGLTDIVDRDELSDQTAGIYANLEINLASILNK